MRALHRALQSALAVLLVLGIDAAGPARPCAAGTPGSIGVFFDPAGTATATHVEFVPPATYFDVYMIAFEPPADMQAFEFGLQWNAPPGVVVSVGGIHLPTGFSSFCDPEPLCVVGGTGIDNCLAPASAVVLAWWRVLALTAVDDVRFRATAAMLSSFHPPAPGMFVCGGDSEADLVPFTLAYDGWAVVNAPVPTGTGTWGAVKSLFGR